MENPHSGYHEGWEDAPAEKPQYDQDAHIKAIDREDGEPIEKSPIQVGVEIGKALCNECMPAGNNYGTVEELYEAMGQKCEEYNAKEQFTWRHISPWEYNQENKSLRHSTTSGRMEILLKDDDLNISLYSPKHASGEDPYYQLSVKGGKLYSTLINPEIVESGERSDRLFHVPEFIAESIPLTKILDASDGETCDVLIEASKDYYDGEIAYRKDEIDRLPSLQDKRKEIDDYVANRLQSQS
ncbi:MAG: hypothetical protein ACOX6Q_03170 [Candidatus Dojkabacteria bacterium]|jgi:hypothetical protein